MLDTILFRKSWPCALSKKDTDHFPPDITSVLAECIHIVPQAASIDLSSGDKGIVLIENTKDFMRPVILRLSDNQIYDLRQDHVYKYLQITDIMKTMDNRVQMDKETLNHFFPDDKLKILTEQIREDLQRRNKKYHSKCYDTFFRKRGTIFPAKKYPISKTTIPPNISSITCCLINSVDANTPRDMITVTRRYHFGIFFIANAA